jgi:hypothetical protein
MPCIHEINMLLALLLHFNHQRMHEHTLFTLCILRILTIRFLCIVHNHNIRVTKTAYEKNHQVMTIGEYKSSHFG